MIDNSKLFKKYDILNSEGPILALYKSRRRLWYMGSTLTDGSGVALFRVSEHRIRLYIESFVTLRELYDNSVDVLITKLYRNEFSQYLKIEFENKLQFGNFYYIDLPNSLKSIEFERAFGFCTLF